MQISFVFHNQSRNICVKTNTRNAKCIDLWSKTFISTTIHVKLYYFASVIMWKTRVVIFDKLQKRFAIKDNDHDDDIISRYI